VIFHLPRDVRSTNAMRSAINERALRNHTPEADRIRAVCEGVRYMVLGSSSAAAVQLGWQKLGGRAPNIHGFGPGHAA
jgi:protein-tyrosine-phosphatase